MRSFALPMIVVGLLLAGACGSSPTEPSYPYDGTWEGTIGDGGQISFTIQQSALRSFQATVPQRTCAGGDVASWSLGAGAPVLGAVVVVDAPNYNLEVHFQSSTGATGTFRTKPICEPDLTWPLTATKQ